MIDRRSSGRALSTASIWPWLTITCCWRPTPASDSSSCTSNSRHVAPLIAYSLSPVRKSVRVTLTSENSMGSNPAELSITSDTSARPRAGRRAVPAKMTSSIFWLRTDDGACAPSTHAMASTTLLLPEPFGPTTTVTPGSSTRVVESANDLKPFSVSDLRNIPENSSSAGPGQRAFQCWQRGQKHVLRPATTRRTMRALRHVMQRSPARSYTRWSV